MKLFSAVFKGFMDARLGALGAPGTPGGPAAPFLRCEVLAARHDAQENVLRVSLRDPDGVFPDTGALEQEMAAFFSVGRAEVRVTAPLSAFDPARAGALLSGALPSLNGFLREAGWEVSDGALTVTPRVDIPADMRESIRADCLRVLSGCYEGLNSVETAESGNRFNTDAFGAERDARVRAVAEEAAAQAPVSAGKAKALIGKAFEAKPVSMDKIAENTGKVCVAGRVFSVDSRETSTGAVLSFDMTDGAGAVRVYRFCKKLNDFSGKAQDIDPSRVPGLVKKGDTVAVRGKMEWRRSGDNEERVLNPFAIQVAELPLSRVDDEPVKRVELHLHTNMSNMDALTDPGRLLKRCADWGHRAVAVTDHGVLHAFPDMMKACLEHVRDEGFKVLYGCEGYLAGEAARLHGRRAFHIILLAKNAAGMRHLFELTSKAHIENFHSHPILTREDIAARRDGLIVGAACEAGELFSAMVHGEPWDELLKICEFYDYLEIQPLSNNLFLIDGGLAEDEEQLREFNRTVCRLGAACGKPVVATGDVHFLDPEDEIFRKIIMESKNMGYTRPLPLFFRTTREMLDEFEYLGRDKAYEVVVANPNAIADGIEALQPVRKDQFFPPRIEGSAEELRNLALTRLTALYGERPPAHITERVRLELDPIIGGGYDVIYMAAQKLVSASLADGYTVGSRGSVGSSIVAYLAGITEVNALPPHYRCPACQWSEFPENPLTASGEPAACGADMVPKSCPACGAAAERDGFDIPFATFLGFEADKKPDIDLNFSGEYQTRAHQHTMRLFGEKNVFRAGTVGTVANKTAVGFVLSYRDSHNLSLSPAEISWLANGCEGVRRTTGQHPGGLIVVPAGNDINEFTPIQYPANKKGEVITTHFDYHAIEDNLLKLDLLGHDDPTMLRYLEDMTGVRASAIDLGDGGVMSLFTSSEALGYQDDPLLGVTGAVAVPEFGTRFVRQMLVDTMPTTFDELVRISGLSHGTDVWIGNAAELVRDGTATLKQIICARDDIMLYLIHMGMDRLEAFYIMESVRKGKGLTPEWEAGMARRGVPAWYIRACKKIKYMFPKSHAVAYVVSAFRIAWYKANHPKAFYSAYFSIRAKDSLDAAAMLESREKIAARIGELSAVKKPTSAEEDKLTLLEVCYEFKLRGFEFDPIDILASDAKNFIITERGLRLPFIAQPGLGEKAAESIVGEREKSPFLSCDDLAARCSALNKTHLETLKKQGALGALPDSTQMSLF